MSQDSSSRVPHTSPTFTFEELMRVVEARDWEALDRMTGMSPEEAERILREEPMVDIEEVNRMLGFTDQEIREALSAPPPPEMFLRKSKTEDSREGPETPWKPS